MTLPAIHQDRMVYHFTHLDNLPSILSQGGLLSTQQKLSRGLIHYDVAYEGIQARRANTRVTCGPGGVVHNYVPFYFAKLTDMFTGVVFRRVADQQLLIFLRVKLRDAISYPYVFSDASANTNIPPTFYNSPHSLANLDWECIELQKWSLKNEVQRHKRMAEFLIHGSVPLATIDSIVVWNKAIADQVQRYLAAQNINIKTEYDSHHFITPFYASEGAKRSIVSGPKAIQLELTKAVRQIAASKGTGCTLSPLDDLLKQLKADLANHPLTGALCGLQDEIHGDVGQHTLQVVEQLKKRPRYVALSAREKKLTKLAAYLHDVGKGIPNGRNRKDGKYKKDTDHPIQALPSCVELLNNLPDITRDEAVAVLTLVCYHDLIGDLCGGGRRVQELAPIARNENTLQMLAALSEADILAVNPLWYDHARIESILQLARGHDGV
ncbi:DUF4433 domain-containing protein [Candidatus Sumerlaeota bacterium]|nr:DUF4433 domain-containing protein [Candidatus Sumerlaeota bacterium]